MINKYFKKLVCFALVATMSLGSSLTVFASETSPATAPVDPYSIEGQYVQELVDISEEELSELSLEDASALFEESFAVSADNYSEDEIRLALNGLSFGLKFQNDMKEVKANTDNPNARSSTANKYYSGSVGVAWVRDTTSGRSPLTLGEILSGTYTLEVDYITLDTVASILASSASYSGFSELSELLASSAASKVLTNQIIAILGLGTGWKASVASDAVGIAVGFGWIWLQKVDRGRMHDVFTTMDSSASKSDMMKVEFMWSGNMVNKFYSKITKSTTLSNPFPGTYGDWYSDIYGYLYILKIICNTLPPITTAITTITSIKYLLNNSNLFNPSIINDTVNWKRNNAG
ncbi:MAG: hypothetical protein ATN33_05245 [Epulopiscium sp. Nele67-Bin001]|nr:MAG: hypothetical protein ATN33_05245 [Epulopiscium sp. Nele67-Bin001]